MVRMRGGKVFKYEYIGALAIILSIGVLAVSSGGFLGLFHHYVNLIATGRSSIKVFGLLAWLFAVFLLPLFFFAKPRKSPDRWLLKRAFVLITMMSLAGTALSFGVIARHQFPLGGDLYAVSNDNFSFTSLVHSHVLKPVVGIFQPLFPNADAGGAWFHVLADEFGFPPPLLSFILFSLLMLLACGAVLFLIASEGYEKPSEKLLYGVLTFVLLKNAVDGGFLNAENLLTIFFFASIFLKKPIFAFATLPFAVFSAILTAGNFIGETVLLAAIYSSLWLFSKVQGKWGKISLVGGLLFVVFTVYAGGTFEFFDQGLRADVADAESSSGILPAGETAYFVARRDGAVHWTFIGQNIEVKNFIKNNDVSFDSFAESIKVDGMNCHIGSWMPVLNGFSLQDREKVSATFASRSGGLIRLDAAKSDAKGELFFDANSCLPNDLGSLFAFIKDSFPQRGAVVVSVSH